MTENYSLILQIALPTPLFSVFSYRSKALVAKGCRVIVPFGNRFLVGVVTDHFTYEQWLQKTPESSRFDLKFVNEIIDTEPILTPPLLTLAEWLAKYYLYPIGEVFRAMLPAGVQKKSKSGYYLTLQGQSLISEAQCELMEESERRFLRELFANSEVITETTYKRLAKKWPHNGAPSLEELLSNGLIKFGKKGVVSARFTPTKSAIEPLDLDLVHSKALQLTSLQQQAMQSICDVSLFAAAADRKPILLRGVTGSGKTELYLQAISAVMGVAKSSHEMAQALVLVPEISLTPQMTQIFTERFAGKVAVVHSAMSDEDRWRELMRIRNGEALVLVGPRSAVFAGFANLKLIIVDEEHDGSYKQQSGLLYHGRDVAILRGRIEQIPVILGSATPSLESYANAEQGKYHLVELTERVNGVALPTIEVVEAKAPQQFGQVLRAQQSLTGDLDHDELPINEKILSELQRNLDVGEQSIVLVNRRGFAYYLYSLKHRKALPCPNCSISLTLHRRSTVLRCHYCDYRKSTAEVLAQNTDDTLVAVGYGSEKLEVALARYFPKARIVRVDSDTVSKRDVLPMTLDKFRRGEIDILVGTQILAKGHDFPKVTLMAILDVDQLLDLPDFRASERTFQLIVQAAGRAGRADLPGRVYVQCSRRDDPTVRDALAQDFSSFARRELGLRQAAQYPPFVKLVHIDMSSSDQKTLEQFVERVIAWFETLAKARPELPQQIRMLGPATPAIELIRNRFRRCLLLTSRRMDALLHISHLLQTAFAKPGADIRLKIDVDAQSLI